MPTTIEEEGKRGRKAERADEPSVASRPVPGEERLAICGSESRKRDSRTQGGRGKKELVVTHSEDDFVHHGCAKSEPSAGHLRSFIFIAIAFWQPIASILITPPRIAKSSSNLGISGISLVLISTVLCANTIPFFVAKAFKTWVAFSVASLLPLMLSVLLQ